MNRCILTAIVLPALPGLLAAAAAVDAISVEVENAALAAPAVTGNDAVASGGRYVQFGAMPASPPGIAIFPGENIQAKIDANPAGTTFIIKPGIHRIAVGLIPKSNDSFIGEPGAVISGAKDISALFVSDGAGRWVASGQTQVNPNRTGFSATSSPAPLYPDDVFRDDALLQRVLSLAEVGPGKFYFDYSAQKIYIGDNPSGHKIEAAVATRAFRAYQLGISGVTLRGLIIEKCANEAQTFAVEARDGYTVEYCEVRLNHGVGLATGLATRGNYVHHNGQMGVGGGGVGSAVSLFEHNEVSFNNTVGYDPAWEAGASKWVQIGLTPGGGMLLRHNWVHDNIGCGLWADGRNYNMIYEQNLVENNTSAGIFHEISFNAKIRNNVVRNNGSVESLGKSLWWGANICINNSEDVEIHGNLVEGAANGIGLIDIDRPQGPEFGQKIINAFVHDNIVIMSAGQTGLVGRSTAFAASAQNRFVNNTYYVGNLAGTFWQWQGDCTKAQWQAKGQDLTGSFLPLSSAPKLGVPLPADSLFGAATAVVTVPAGGATYVVWTRLQAPNSVNNSVILQVDGGPGSIAGNGPLVPGVWTWVNYRDGVVTLPLSLTLAAGTHTLKFIGREPGVRLDRVLLIANGAVPTGTGDNVSARRVRGDFNGDAKSDLLLRHPSNGSVNLWLMR